MGRMAATAEPQLIPIGTVLGRCGGTEQRIRQSIQEAGGEIVQDWSGDDSVDTNTARRVVARHEEQLALHKRIGEGYALYWKQRADEARMVRKRVYDAECERLHEEQRAEFRKMPRVSGGEFLSLDPRRIAIANELAQRAVDEWEKRNPPMVDENEWARKEGII